jgi:hypothetical protein
MPQDEYLKETRLLNYSHRDLVALVERKNWRDLEAFDRIAAIYRFVKDEVPFGYNESDDLAASRLLHDGYGQCNTKATLLMALLRSVGISCRMHASLIDKRVQRGLIPDPIYALTPARLLHTWVEVLFDGRWSSLEGCILDEDYLGQVHSMFPDARGSFCGFAVAVSNFREPRIAWQGEDTHIQSAAVTKDLGVFASPDSLYAAYRANLRGIRGFLFKHLVRSWMNRRVASIRMGQASVRRDSGACRSTSP